MDLKKLTLAGGAAKFTVAGQLLRFLRPGKLNNKQRAALGMQNFRAQKEAEERAKLEAEAADIRDLAENPRRGKGLLTYSRGMQGR